jgi:hypothetical protein
MRLDAYSTSALQHTSAVCHAAIAAGITDVVTLAATIAANINSRVSIQHPRYAASSRPDNLTICQVCGKPAVIVPLSQADSSVSATHAIQCQNRPATDQPWCDGMCGHTEYVIRGSK